MDKHVFIMQQRLTKVIYKTSGSKFWYFFFILVVKYVNPKSVLVKSCPSLQIVRVFCLHILKF